ncbi:MAG: alpha/beta hydrolase [Candidatus Pacebacteria bacterium]|nr:alpha/beta hydrolase [Candidatus Paceibacterota bacterium]
MSRVVWQFSALLILLTAGLPFLVLADEVAEPSEPEILPVETPAPEEVIVETTPEQTEATTTIETVLIPEEETGTSTEETLFKTADIESTEVSMTTGVEAPETINGGETVTWIKAGGPYLVTNTYIYGGGTLIIEPGTVVKIRKDGDIGVAGTLQVGASGSEDVIFTSIADDSYGGDSDGVVANPEDYRWMRINFSWNGGSGTFNNARFRHGGSEATVVACAGTVSISNTVFEAISGDQLRLCNGNDITVDHADFQGQRTIAYFSGGSLNVTNSAFRNVSYTPFEFFGPHPWTISALNNWWNDASGPSYSLNQTGLGHVVPDSADVVPWLTEDPFLTPPPVETGPSNVLFLPGIKGSYLYKEREDCVLFSLECEDTLWLPSLFEQVTELFLDSDGKSINEVYVKKGSDGVLESAFGMKFYASFVEDMDALVTDSTINDWEAVPYDWRLSLPDLLSNGVEDNGRIFYGQASSTPYIEQTLRELARTSKSGKVTIVAHSNGGLVAKALMQKLGETETVKLVDDVIFVGVPQLGAPQALGALLYGDREALPTKFTGGLLVDQKKARQLAENTPMAYHLLPSQTYFETTQDGAHPVGKFANEEMYASEISAHGKLIGNSDELYNFLLAKDGGRTKPPPEEIDIANILNSTLITYAKDTHETLDSWVPPSGVTLYQFAGWGADTVAGVEFNGWCNQLVGCTQTYKPILVEDGDKVVPAPSALHTSSDEATVNRYWIDLSILPGPFKPNHGNLFEITEVKNALVSIIGGTEIRTGTILNSTQPASRSAEKKLRFYLHSPLTLGVYDENENYTGQNEDGSVSFEVDGVDYGTFGETQYLTVSGDENYTLALDGLDDGTFTLEIEDIVGEEVTASTTFVGIPTTADTQVTMQISNREYTETTLNIDEDGDGTQDTQIPVSAGDVYFYEVPQTIENFGGGGRSNNEGTGIVFGTSTEAVPEAIISPPLVTKATSVLTEPVTLYSGTEVTAHPEVSEQSQQLEKDPLLTLIYNLLSNFLNFFLELFGIKT